MKLKEKIWLLAAPAHDDDIYFGSFIDRRFGSWSRITPGEGALLLGLENVIMMPSGGVPVPFADEAIGYLESFCRMKNVWWGVTGSDGFRIGNEEDFIVEASKEYKNLTGAFSNNLFDLGKSEDEIKSILQKVRKTLNDADRKMEIWVSVYNDAVNTELYEGIDGIVVWNKNTDEIPLLEKQFELYEKLLPHKKKMLGIPMYDYEKRQAVSEENMEFACEVGKKLIKEGRIEGAVIRSNCTMGLGFYSDFKLRDWMERNGDEEI